MHTYHPRYIAPLPSYMPSLGLCKPLPRRNFAPKTNDMETPKGGVLITPKEIQLLTGRGYKACQKEHLAIRDALGKTGGMISIGEYCAFNQLDYDEVVSYLNQFRK